MVSGKGELYRSSVNGGVPIALHAGVSVRIDPGDVFQFRAVDNSALTIHITTAPPWTGDHDVETGMTGYW